MKIIIVILLVAIIPVGLIVALLGAFAYMLPMLLIAGVVIGICCIFIKFATTPNHKPLYKKLEEKGFRFDPKVAVDFYNTCLRDYNIKVYLDTHDKSLKQKAMEQAAEIAKTYHKYKFKMVNKDYWSMLMAVDNTKNEVEVEHKKLEDDRNSLIDERARQSLLGTVKNVPEMFTEFYSDRQLLIKYLSDNICIIIDYFRACEKQKIITVDSSIKDKGILFGHVTNIAREIFSKPEFKPYINVDNYSFALYVAALELRFAEMAIKNESQKEEI